MGYPFEWVTIYRILFTVNSYIQLVSEVIDSNARFNKKRLTMSCTIHATAIVYSFSIVFINATFGDFVRLKFTDNS